MKKFIENYLKETASIAKNIDIKSLNRIIDGIYKVREKKGRIFFLGVGGSAAHASHAVNDFRKLANIECYAPTDNVSELTARTNDEGWKWVFQDWLKVSRLNKKDIIFIFSVGGGNVKKKVSENLVQAIKLAKNKKVKIYGIVGKNGGYTKKAAEACICIPSKNSKLITPHTEGFAAVIWHLIISHPRIQKNKTKW
ncbi:MAG: SIS domain-containing protein [Candidatus Pelagibacter sp.]|tara:strand:+ start:725 stop:1312 length:588 start_codon:yes stop_codon:yes gene_type:complete